MLLLVIELVALACAAIDFWSAGEAAQRVINGFLDGIRRRRDWFDAKSGVLLKWLIALVVIIGVVVGVLKINEADQVLLDQLTAASGAVIMCVGLLVFCFGLAWFGLWSLLWIFYVLSLPKSGVVGSLGLAAAAGAVLLNFFLHPACA